MKISTLVLLGLGGYLAYEYLKQSSASTTGLVNSTAGGVSVNGNSTGTGNASLPVGAVFVQQIQALGTTVNVYMDANGYYAAIMGTNNEPVRVFGPYSQTEVYTILDAKNALSSIGL